MTSMKFLMISMCFVAACSATPSQATRSISGKLDPRFHLSGAKVVAMSNAKHVFVAPIAADGTFHLALPVGGKYSLHFANSTASPTLLDEFARLSVTRGATQVHWFTITAGANIDLGLVGSLGKAGLARDGGDDSADDGSDDGEEHDDEDTCDLSGGGDDEDVDCEHDPGDDCDADHDGTPDSADDSDDSPECATATDDGDDCHLSGDEEDECDHDEEAPCTPTPPTDPGTPTPPTPPPVPGIG